MKTMHYSFMMVLAAGLACLPVRSRASAYVTNSGTDVLEFSVTESDQVTVTDNFSDTEYDGMGGVVGGYSTSDTYVASSSSYTFTVDLQPGDSADYEDSDSGWDVITYGGDGINESWQDDLSYDSSVTYSL